jgi:hypothetical protein
MSDVRTEYMIEFRTFIVSSLCAIPNDTIRSFRSMIGKYSSTNANLWLKRVVCEVLKGSWSIWVDGRDNIYNMMRPIITL